MDGVSVVSVVGVSCVVSAVGVSVVEAVAVSAVEVVAVPAVVVLSVAAGELVVPATKVSSGVEVPPSGAQAAANRMRVSDPNKNRREIFFISLLRMGLHIRRICIYKLLICLRRIWMDDPLNNTYGFTTVIFVNSKQILLA